MRFRFTKMHGLGNDFVMLDAVSQKIVMTPERARQISDRHFGIGCDQILIVEPPKDSECDFRYRIFNHDGAEVENCGNGARCFALFVRQRGLTNKREIRVQTDNGNMVLSVLDDDQVTVNMGEPILEPVSIPFDAPVQSDVYDIDVGGSILSIGAVSMGNPHAVSIVENLNELDLELIGPQVEHHPRFPNRVNAGFMQITSQHTVQLRVFERGAGETLACGTGACAAVVSGQVRGLLAQKVTVHLPGGQLIVEWEGLGKPVMMTGPATTVFHGQIRL